MEMPKKTNNHLRALCKNFITYDDYIICDSGENRTTKCSYPANSQRRNNVVTRSLQRHNVVTTLLRRCMFAGHVLKTYLESTYLHVLTVAFDEC